MSNFLAVATVTATLRRQLQATVGADVPGADVRAGRPEGVTSGTPPTRVNIYLYQVAPNGAYRNADLPTRAASGDLRERPQVGLDLQYLLSFAGDEDTLEPQRLLGSVARTLHARPLLTRQMIQNTLADPGLGFLAGSNGLAEQVERIKFTPLPLSLEELSKLWSVFFQVPYSLSMAYQATVVLIDSEVAPRAALPVLGRNLYVVPFRRAVIERVVSQAGELEPIVAGATLLLRGAQLRSDTVRVRMAGQEVEPASTTDTEISLPLTMPPFAVGTLRAGVQGVQLVYPMMMGTPEVPHRGFESNIAAFVLRPQVSSPSASATLVTFQVDPTVGKNQRVVLLLHENAAVAPAAYTFPDEPRSADTNTLEIAISGVKPGQYFVRIQIDGAESPLDLDAASPGFGPMVTIP
jgi:hypothetical protein